MKQDSAFLLEQHHLDNTIQEMQHIVDCLQEDVTARDDQIRTARDRKEEISTYVHTMLQRDHHHKISDIQSSLPNPYFGRVDFREDATPEFHSYYIGRVKVNRPEINGPEDILVFDWRDPVSTVFYECEGGRASYQVLDRYHYHGDVRLKRQYKVEDGQLKTMVDDPLLDKLIALQQGGLNADPFLQERLLQGAGDKLRDIVTSIQSEQNKIIRDPLNQVTIIQGVAGSGKSTVGLHRLSYLLYNEKLDPGKLVIIAPNRIFLDYIGELLPNIDARGVRQWVWEDLTSIVTARTWDLAPDQRLNILLETGPEQKDRRDQLIYAARCKGSHEFMAVLDTYMAKKTEKYCLKLKDITLFDGRLHLSCRQQVDRFMADVSAPYLERIRSLNQYIRFTVNNFLEVEESRQQLALSIGMDLSRYRREADKFLATLSRHQSDWDLLTAYREVFTSKSHFKPLKNLKGNLEWLMAHSLTILDTGRVERDDLAPLCYLHYLSTGWHHLTKFDHIVVDEAQDLNIMEFSVLKLLSGNGSFTIMGDMSQGIHAYRSIESWNMLKAEVFSTDRSVYREILYSYRSSREIVELCNRVMPTGHSPAVPVYETGHRPTVEKIQPEPAAAAQLLKALERFQQLGHRSMGVITRRETDSRELYRQLTPLLPTAGFDIQLVTDQSTGYRGGISLLPVSLAKGLEFDAVILWDASAEQFQANDFDARLLYVALSRAMHGLHIFYRNHLTPLLSKKRNTSI